MQHKWWSILFGVVLTLAGLLFVIAPIMGWLCLLGGTVMGVLDLLIHHERLLPH